MTEKEIVATIKQKKDDCEARLKVLYATFNKTELSIAGEREQELGEDVAQEKEHLQVLKDRQDVIGGAGHNKHCPCCGLKLPRGYYKKLVEDVKEQEEKVAELESELNKLATEREHLSSNSLTAEIGRLEQELDYIKKLETEAKDVGII